MVQLAAGSFCRHKCERCCGMWREFDENFKFKITIAHL